jgi:hypothetical protein
MMFACYYALGKALYGLPLITLWGIIGNQLEVWHDGAPYC